MLINRILSFASLFVVIALAHGCKTPSVLVTEEQQKGDYYNNRYEYDQAVIHYENMLAASRKLGVYRNLDMEADVCRKIAHARSVQGHFDRAIEYLQRALELDSLQGNPVEIIEDYREMGKVHLYMGDFTGGISHLQHALSLNEGMENSLKGVNQLSIADTYLTLSRLYTVLGDFSQAESYIQPALRIFRNMDNPEGEMESLLQLGRISIRQGSGDAGEQYVIRSMHMAEDLGLNIYRHKEELALLNENRARYEEALRLKLEAVDEVRQTGNLPQVIWAHMLTGDLYWTIGDRERARTFYQASMAYLDSSQIRASALDASINLREGDIDRAYTYFSAAGSEVAAGVAGMRLGEVALEWGAFPEAMGHFLKSLGHFTAAGLSDGMARANMMIGLTAMEMDSLHLAASSLTEAEKYVLYDETRWRVLYARGTLYEKQEMPDYAISLYRKSIDIIEGIRGNFTVEEFRSLYLEDRLDVYNRLIRLLMEKGRDRDSFIYAERARARTFLDMLGNNRIRISSDGGSDLMDLEQDLRQEIQSLSKLLQKGDMDLTRGMDRQRIEKEIFEAREQYNEVLEKLKLFNPDYASMVNMETAGIPEIQSNIDPVTALLVYWVGAEELYIWMLTRNGIESRVIPAGEDEVIDLVMKCRETVGSRSYKEVYSVLYDRLIKPFEGELEEYSTIGVIPHLPLHFLPFQCLMPDPETYLVDRFNIFYSPSASTYTLVRAKEPDSERVSVSGKGIDQKNEFLALALGGIELGGLPGLPGTTREISTISTLFREPTVAYEDASTETFFKSVVAPFRYVHLATHGVLDPNQPMFSYLTLAPTEEDDGLLTVREIFGLNMNASLVVLSACETALGALSTGDEIIGMSRAFLYAGSSDVIVSLWSVADEPTAILMTRFYQLLEEHSAVESLRLAQIEVKESYEIPSYWAPFQIIGAGY